ncbi:MAG: TonB-dependent receptor [Porticoccaceae bacterium]|nr:TonB-dependent receptor [Porticoccaceae bacterium]
MKITPLTKAIRASIGASLLLSASMPLLAQDTNEEIEIEEISVTGSRIKRTKAPESQTVISITAQDMKLSGDVSVADALRSSTLNSLGSFRESSGNSAQSNATFNLRGAGASRTAVLINGRRTVGSASLGGGGSVNLNLIPMSFVERIDILADGASAVYGSDAVTGVVNVILKSGYDGAEFTVRYGDRSKDNGSEHGFSFLTGAQGDKGSVTFGIEMDTRDPVFDKDRSFTAARYSDLNGDGFITGYQETEGVSFYGYSLINPNYDTSIPFSDTNRDTWYVNPGLNCVDDGSFVGELKADAVFGPDAGFYCGYAYANVSANRASMDRINAYVNADYDVSDDVSIYVDAILSNNESFGRYAPPAAPGVALAGDPKNPFGQEMNGYFRWVDIGTRDNVVNDTLVDVNFGVDVDINDDLSFEAYYTYSDYRSASIGQYYLSYGGFAENVAEGITDYDTYVANLKSTTLNDDRMNQQKLFAGIQYNMFEMAGGQAILAAGIEHFDINYAALVDAQSEAGLVGGSAGNSAEGSRSVKAITAEAILPVTDYLEVDLAVRYDDYSDFGNEVSPRVGATFTMIDNLVLKASYGQGFRAPDLASLYGATSFSAEGATDYYGCALVGTPEADCTSRQFDTFIGSNPDLGAETSETFSFGAQYTYNDNWVGKLQFVTLELQNAVEYVSAQDMLNVDYNTGGNNPQVVRQANGSVTSIAAGYQNAVSDVSRESLDMGIDGTIDTDAYGSFRIRSEATKYLKYETEAQFGTGILGDAVDTLGFPEWRSNATVSWTMGNWSAAFSADYIGESESSSGEVKWDSYKTYNLNASYDLSDYGSLTIGANNLTNEDPLLDAFGSQADEYQYSILGRVIYMQYTIEM